jgi:hypothetical protein
MANYGTKTFNLYEKKDPIRNLWRNKEKRISIQMEQKSILFRRDVVLSR